MYFQSSYEDDDSTMKVYGGSQIDILTRPTLARVQILEYL